MSKNVEVEHTLSDSRVTCLNCDRLHPLATRERVRLHVQKTGHTAEFVVARVSTYRPERSASS